MYPGAKSFSFVIFSTLENAIRAFNELDDTRPNEFPEQSWPIALLYIKQGNFFKIIFKEKNRFLVPQESILTATKIPDGLSVFNDFISPEEESNLIKFLDKEETKSRKYFTI